VPNIGAHGMSDLAARNPKTSEQGIRVRGLVKRFGSVVALNGLDLEVGPGEIVALLGPNGAGKSTLLRILGTTVLPDHGSASVAGADVVTDPVAARRQLGLVVGDEHALYWRLTGRENLRFFGSLYGMSKSETDARSAELLEALGLAEAADRRVLGYSSGMRTRLLLGRALLTDPPLLLLDEPTRNLDPVAAVEFRETALRLAERRGAGILFATHDLHEATSIANRVVVLSAGRAVLAERVGGLDPARLEARLLEAIGSGESRGEELDPAAIQK
jgi:ABC-2 type transport system ATP-binding protein